MLKNLIRTQDFYYSVKMLIKYIYTNAKIRIYHVGIYLLKVNNENSRTSCVICSKLTNKHQNDIIDIKKLQSCKLYNKQYIIASTRINNTEIFTLIAILVFTLLSCKVLFMNRKDNINC